MVLFTLQVLLYAFILYLSTLTLNIFIQFYFVLVYDIISYKLN
nr:MAG TPA: hypothetical protein [Caudoviricetes sp.]